MLTRLITAFCLVLCLAWPARAGEVSEVDAAAFARIIDGQIKAFNADDTAAAYAHAAPLIHQMFPDPEAFMAMVRQGYTPVYRQRSYAFGKAREDTPGLPIQEVKILDANGKSWIAVYTFQKQPDGSWKINGCSLKEVPGADA